MSARAITVAFTLGLAAIGGTAHAQDYPTQPLRFIVTGPAGSPTDIVARRVALRLTERLKQQIIVDNRAGGRTVGPGEVAKAPPDGHTLLFTVDTYITVNPALYKKLPYDPARDFAPVSIVAALKNFILAVHPSAPVRSVKEYVALARQNPGKVTAANTGAGGPAHLVTALFALNTKIQLLNVPYKGGNLALNDLMGGYVDSMFAPAQNTIGAVNDRRLVGLAVTSSARLPTLPGVPTFAEAGFPDFSLNHGFWYGVLAPAATPPGVVARLAQAIRDELANTELRAAYTAMGVDPIGSTTADFARIIKEDTARWAAVIREAKITVE